MTVDAGRLQELTHAGAGWSGLRVVVAGIGVSGFAAADALLERGARVLVVDGRDGAGERERAQVLRTLDARVDLGPDAATVLPQVDGGRPDLVVTSPGWRPDQPLLAGRPRPASRSGARSSWPGGCARPPGPRPG